MKEKDLTFEEIRKISETAGEINKLCSDMASKQNQEAVSLEIQARILRLTKNMSVSEAKSTAMLNPADASILERIVSYIAHNYDRPIKISDIGRTVGVAG